MFFGPSLDDDEATKLRVGQLLICYSGKSEGTVIAVAASVLGMELNEDLGLFECLRPRLSLSTYLTFPSTKNSCGGILT